MSFSPENFLLTVFIFKDLAGVEGPDTVRFLLDEEHSWSEDSTEHESLATDNSEVVAVRDF